MSFLWAQFLSAFIFRYLFKEISVDFPSTPHVANRTENNDQRATEDSWPGNHLFRYPLATLAFAKLSSDDGRWVPRLHLKRLERMAEDPFSQ